MVLRLKTRESRSLPGLPSIWCPSLLKTLLRAHIPVMGGPIRRGLGPLVLGDAGWSSPVARQAHNLKVAGSNPAPATKYSRQVDDLAAFFIRGNQRGGPSSEGGAANARRPHPARRPPASGRSHEAAVGRAAEGPRPAPHPPVADG